MRALFQRAIRRFDLARQRLFHTITAEMIDDILHRTIPSPPSILFVHSSLSRCGFLTTGPEGLLQSLKQNCETLCLPTHTYCYPKGGHTPTFDPKQTSSLIGRITNVFWQSDGVVRSIHPTHSLAAEGPRAVELCANHMECETPCGPGTPYEKLVQADAAVLMFGTTMNTYTLFHYSEDIAGCSYLYVPTRYELLAKDYRGATHEIPFRRQDMSVPRRFIEMRDELHSEGLLNIVPFGLNELLYIPSSSDVHEYTTARLRENEYHLLKGKTWPPTP